MSIANGNLDARVQATQLRVGVVMVAFGLALAVALARTAASPLARALVFLPLFIGGYGVQAGLYKTCAFTAVAGRRLTDDGSEIVADQSERGELRRIGVRLLATSAGVSALATALLVLAR